jgi:hypothetical protein
LKASFHPKLEHQAEQDGGRSGGSGRGENPISSPESLQFVPVSAVSKFCTLIKKESLEKFIYLKTSLFI